MKTTPNWILLIFVVIVTALITFLLVPKGNDRVEYITKIERDPAMQKSLDSLKAIDTERAELITALQTRLEKYIKLKNEIKTKVSHYTPADVQQWLQQYRADSARLDMD